MNLTRIHKKASLMQQDRLPVATYEQAIDRLVQRKFEGVSEDALDELVMLVADIFWSTDLQVRRDVIVAARKLGG